MNGLGGGMYPPTGYVNPTTPGSATVRCGNVVQTSDFTTNGAIALPIGFSAPTSWSDPYSWIPNTDGTLWTCQNPGIYNFRASQNLTIANSSLTATANTIIPATTFFMDCSGVDLPPLVEGNLITEPNDVDPGSSITYTTDAPLPLSNVSIANFTTPVGFLTSTVVAGGNWVFSLWSSSDSPNGDVAFYVKMYEVDLDGISNPIEVFDGSSSPVLIASADPYVVQTTLAVPSFTFADLSKRLKVEILCNFDNANDPADTHSVTLYFRNTTQSNLQTTLSQIALAPNDLIQDTINLDITVTSTVDEFNQVISESIPVTVVGTEVLIYSRSVSGNIIGNVGDTLQVTIASVNATSSVISGFSIFPAPAAVLSWNLIADGVYGNAF